MSGAFDPYHRWLGISPKDQPPNHYRLLAIDLFEPDPDVIRDAAEQRMAHVRTYQLGQHVELSQRILNELAVAKACLLDAPKKAAYDAVMKRRVQQPTKTPALSEKVYSVMPSAPAVKAPAVARPGKRTDVASPHIESRLPAVVGQKGSVGRSEHRPTADAGRQKDQVFPRTPPNITRLNTTKRPNRPQEPLITSGRIVTVVALAFGMVAAFFGYRQVVEFFDSGSRSSQAVGQRPVADGIGSPKPPSIPVVRPPKLGPIQDFSVDEGTLVQFKAAIMDAGTVGPALRFRLEPDAPVGAVIDARTGVFVWRPTREQAPGEYSIAVRAMADGLSTLGDQVTFHVSVRKVVKPPVILPLGRPTIRAGGTAQIRIPWSNPGGPLEKVVVSLPEAPSWVTIDSTTGVIICSPDPTVSPKSYKVTVRATNEREAAAYDEKTMEILVTAPPKLSEQTKKPRYSQPGVFTIQLPSGTTVASADVRILSQVRDEVTALKEKCRNNAPTVIGMYQEGSRSSITALSNVKGTKLYGTTVLFHPNSAMKPKHYITYWNGLLHGTVASWDNNGQQHFWCNYSSGKRDGLCCLFKDDMLAAVLECTRDKIDSVHLIAANEITKSFTAVEIATADDAAGPLLHEIDKLEKRIKDDAFKYRERVKQKVQTGIGLLNQQKRDAFRERSSERGAAQEQTFRALRKAGGL